MTQIESLHSLYCKLTGLAPNILKLDMAREQDWYQWQRRGFGESELRLVIEHIKQGIRKGKRRSGALKFSNLIVSADLFEEDLAEAKACARVPKVNPHKTEALEATGRMEDTTAKARSADEIIKGPGFKSLVNFRKSLEPNH